MTDKKTETKRHKIEKRLIDDLKELIDIFKQQIEEDPSPIAMHLLVHKLLVYQLYHFGKPDFSEIYEWIEKAYDANKHNTNITNVFIDHMLAHAKSMEKICNELALHWKTLSDCTTNGGNTIFIPEWFTKRS